MTWKKLESFLALTAQRSTLSIFRAQLHPKGGILALFISDKGFDWQPLVLIGRARQSTSDLNSFDATHTQ